MRLFGDVFTGINGCVECCVRLAAKTALRWSAPIVRTLDMSGPLRVGAGDLRSRSEGFARVDVPRDLEGAFIVDDREGARADSAVGAVVVSGDAVFECDLIRAVGLVVRTYSSSISAGSVKIRAVAVVVGSAVVVVC